MTKADLEAAGHFEGMRQVLDPEPEVERGELLVLRVEGEEWTAAARQA